MDEYEVIDKWTYYTSPVVTEDCVNDEHEDSIRNYLDDKNYTEVNDEVREISIETDNEYIINKDITDNETEKNLDTYKEVIDECPDDTSTDMMEDGVNKNLDDTNKKYLNEINEIGVYEDGGYWSLL